MRHKDYTYSGIKFAFKLPSYHPRKLFAGVLFPATNYFTFSSLAAHLK